MLVAILVGVNAANYCNAIPDKYSTGAVMPGWNDSGYSLSKNTSFGDLILIGQSNSRIVVQCVVDAVRVQRLLLTPGAYSFVNPNTWLIFICEGSILLDGSIFPWSCLMQYGPGANNNNIGPGMYGWNAQYSFSLQPC